ncbi:MAG: hypothetical protein H7095_01530 [Pseudopedobacter sp.]|nr:hypothetical protein [Deinococcales bacterium]
MTVPIPQPSSAAPRIPKIVWDLLFTLAVPVTLLASKLPFTEFNFSDALGTRTAFVLAGLIPAAYILIDTWRTRKFNPVTALAAGSALTGGVLAFLQIDGWQFALKDSYASIFVTLVMGISLLGGRPFFGFVLRVAMLPDSPKKERALDRLLSAPTVAKALFWGTLIIMLEAILNGTINFFVNLQNVVAQFGTKDFNAQVAGVNAIMRLPSIVLSLLAYGFAYYYVQWAVERDFGSKAKLFEDGMWEALKETTKPLESA